MNISTHTDGSIEFVQAMEKLRFPIGKFNHEAHIRLAWIYLQKYQFLEGMIAFRDTLKRFAAHHGAAEKYSETITLIFVLLVHDRMALSPCQDWPSFQESNPDLFGGWRALLSKLYDQKILDLPSVKKQFHLPDRWRTTSS